MVRKIRIVGEPVKFADTGARVRRGPDWKWGDQDEYGAGTIVGKYWVRVEWDHGRSNAYRVGRDRFSNAYDLVYAEDSPDGESVDPVPTRASYEIHASASGSTRRPVERYRRLLAEL